jgi:hypothetical protein
VQRSKRKEAEAEKSQMNLFSEFSDLIIHESLDRIFTFD